MKQITKTALIPGAALVMAGIAAASTVYPPGTYFSLSSDGQSYNGTAIPIGGTNPIPVDATLTGTFSPVAITVNGAGATILPDFTVMVLASPHLVDGDLSVIYATDATNSAITYPVGVLSWDVIFPGNAGQFDIANLTGPNALAPDFPITSLVNLNTLTLTVDFSPVTTVPEPVTWIMTLTGIMAVIALRRRIAWRARIPSKSTMAKCFAVVACSCAGHSAFGQVHLATATVPSSGVAGITSVNLIGDGFPAGTINPAGVVVTLSTTCGGTAAATSTATSIITILGTTERVSFNVPGGITTGNYFVTVAGPGFSTIAGSCAALSVQGSAPILNACVAASSMGVLLPGGGAKGNVTAYVPKGYWTGNTAGIFVQNIEGTSGPSATIPTPHITNSCSSNPATGQTVCVANNTDVYLITGTTLNNTLTSSSDSLTTFSGGSCNNCGVAVNAANNTAAINMGVSSGVSSSGVQILDLNTNTFNPPFGMTQQVSENISVDPTRSLILSANEFGNYPILQIQTNGSLLEFNSAFNSGFENDSSAEDCSTGVAIAPGEFTSAVQLVNLNNITLAGATYTAPNAVADLSSGMRFYAFSAGASGSAVAQGSGHLAVVTGEFGGNTFAVLQLPAVPSTGTPSVVDFAVAQVPANAACGGGFSAGFDPHTITAYTSPNTGDAYAVFAGYSSGGVPACLAVVDMTTVINPASSPRGGSGYGTHEIAPADLPASALTFFPL